MKKIPFSIVASLFLLIPAILLQSQYNPANLSLAEDVAVERYSLDKLRIYPITANRVFIEAHKSLGNYKPLKKGLEDGTVKILERGAGASTATPVNTVESLGMVPPTHGVQTNLPANANHRNFDGHVMRYQQHQETIGNQGEITNEAANEVNVRNENIQQRQVNVEEREIQIINGGGSASDEVNKLFIQNTSNDSVFIMAGEVVKGGKQDRVIAMDMVIPPHSEPIDLSVYCVEHGRWTYGGADAEEGFTGHANVANTSVRKAAIVSKSQSEVWGKVEEVTVANDAISETGTLNALEKDADYQRELGEYERKFGDLPSSMQSVIGVVAVTGDRVIGCDMFATPDLFRNAYPDLLKSYASEAITSGAPVRISNAAVDKYIANILDESKQKERVEENGQMYRRGTRTMHISTF